MNKAQVNKRTKRGLRSKQKRKERNINRTKTKKSQHKRSLELLKFFSGLDKTSKEEILKNLNKEE